MATGFPDWIRAMVLLGTDGTKYIPVLLDEDGNLNVLMRGEDGGGNLQMVRVDDDGQIITVLRGESGNYLDVDDDGFMTAVMKGDKGAGALATIAVDANGQLIMVPRGKTGNYLNVDADGFMTTVIKGDYEGALTTVKCDDEGRLSAFVIDSADAWGNMLQIGNAELAARTGSLMSYDGRGQYQYGYDFSGGLTSWITQALGTGAAVSLTPETYERGGYSVRLTGGSDGAKQATCYRRIDVMESKTFGFEVGVSIAASIDWLNIIATYRDGTTAHTAGVKYDDTNDLLRCRVPGPDWQTFATSYQMYHNASAYHVFKFVWDIDAGYYIRALIAGHLYDISAYQILTSADATAPYMDIAVTVQSRVANNDSVNLDYVVLTNQE